MDAMLGEMDELASDVGVASVEWSIRREVLERLLVRPLRGYRAELIPVHQQNNVTTEATLLEAKLKRGKHK